jgi:heme o synthase
MFKYSILYMMLLCTAVVVDSLPQVQSAIALLWK